MVEKLNDKDKYFAIVYWPKGSKNLKELLDYFATKDEADKEVARQKELDKHSETKFEYDIVEKSGKQVKDMW